MHSRAWFFYQKLIFPQYETYWFVFNVGGFLTFENSLLKYAELTKKGFVILDITAEKIQGDWYYVSTIDQMNSTNSCQKSFYYNDGSGTMIASNSPATGHGPFSAPLMVLGLFESRWKKLPILKKHKLMLLGLGTSQQACSYRLFEWFNLRQHWCEYLFYRVFYHGKIWM